jgi:signal transduction histidine kinase
MVVVVILIAIWLASLLTRRVTHLTQGLAKIEQGELAYRLPNAGDDEMGQLTNSINRMADSVQASFQRLDEARERAEEANRMKSSFLATMSHELRTPLNGILGFAELLKLELQEEEPRSYAENIHSSGQHLLDLVNDVLDLAKIEAGRMELQHNPLDLRDLLSETASVHRVSANSKGLSFSEQLADDLPVSLNGDGKRIRQVLNNLLNNAVKFTPSGSVEFQAERVNNFVKISVHDTGVGIPPEMQEKVFEKFTQADHFATREQGGSGLGLALARELVCLMGGELGLESAPGKGSTFHFTLPIV